MEQSVLDIKALVEGDSISYDGAEIRLPWATQNGTSQKLPIWIAGYGPKALALAGRVADGVILQFADPHLISWCMTFVRQGAEAAGRDPASIRIMAAAPVWVSDDLAAAREHVRWFPALVSNHVMDLIARYNPSELPEELTAYVRNRPGYNYQHHAEVGSSNGQFVTDEVVDRFCIVGPVEEQQRRLRELAELGVDQFNIYLMSGNEESTVDVYGKEIIPAITANSVVARQEVDRRPVVTGG
jgi:alkanesulfonate monooxygenase SsuD/methylene tetrahydromethanopterin reductase-like flavin-dependent oxidoreductase (luciferase family)